MLSLDAIFSRSHCESRCLALLAYAKNQQNDDMLNYAVYAWEKGGGFASLDACVPIFLFRSCHRPVISFAGAICEGLSYKQVMEETRGVALHASKTHTVTMINSDVLGARTDQQSNGKKRFAAIHVGILRTIARWRPLGE
jgi:hypothetical protein